MNRTAKYYKTDKENTFIKVELFYELGGFNYFTYKTDSRGYYISVRPVVREERNGYTSESFNVMQGYKKLMKEVKRKSEKAFNEALNLSEGIEKEIVDVVCAECGLKVLGIAGRKYH